MYIRHYVSPADAWFDEKLGKDAWWRPIHNPLTYTKKPVFTT